jgi:hypothetical protein
MGKENVRFVTKTHQKALLKIRSAGLFEGLFKLFLFN